MDPAIETRRFDTPNDKLDMKDHGGIDVVKMSDGTTGVHAIFVPGWSWEKDEKPSLGSPDTCPMRHTGYCISGRLVVRMVETASKHRSKHHNPQLKERSTSHATCRYQHHS